jgi:hypothetical protein
MESVRVLRLYDSSVRPPTWNERMRVRDFAVLFANQQPADLDPALGAVAVLFESCDEAEAYARREAAKEPYLRCSIYDSRGMGAPPLAVIAGARGADTNVLSSKFRLWIGGICLVVGIGLGWAEILSGMSLTWAGLIGSRIGPIGVVLLLTEVGMRLSERWKQKPS